MTPAEIHEELHRRRLGLAGGTPWERRREIAAALAEHDCDTVLDFGCGRAAAWRRGLAREILVREEDVTLYEPYWPDAPPKIERSRPHGRWDAVLAMDVLEHIPETDIPETLLYIYGAARRLVYLVISTRDVRSTHGLPSPHLTVRPREWWDLVIGPWAGGCPTVIVWSE